MMKVGKACVLLVFFLIPFFSFSQTITVETQHFSEENGLSLFANFIHKDSRGIIWIGTQFGLYRYNGQDFTHFDESSGLPFRQIMEIYEDSEGWFWLYLSCRGKPNCEKNLAFFHPFTKEVLTFEERFGNKVSIRPSQIESLAGGGEQFFFTGNQKLFIWEAKRGIREVAIQGLDKTPSIWTKINDRVLGGFVTINNDADALYLAIDTTGNLLQTPQEFPGGISNYYKLRIIGIKSFEFEAVRINNLEISFNDNGALLVDTLSFSLPSKTQIVDYQYWDEQLYSDTKGYIYHPDLGAFSDKEITYPRLLEDKSLSRIPQSNVWIKKKGNEAREQHFQQIISHFPAARHTFFDHTNRTLWGANGQGAKMYHFNNEYFQHTTKKGEEKLLAFSTIEIDSDRVLMLAHNSSYLLKASNEIVDLSEYLKDKVALPAGKNLYIEKGQTYFWFCWMKALYRINKDDFSSTEYPHNGVIGKPRRMISWDGDLLLAGTEGLYTFDLEEKIFEAFSAYNDFEILKTAKIHFFKKINENKLLLCSDKGIFVAEKNKGLTAQFSNTQQENNFLPAQNFFHISEAKEGGYWLASMNGLIWVPHDFYRSKNDPIKYRHYSATPAKSITDNQPLPTNELLGAFEDDYGFVWMPTPHGLIQFQINSGLSKLYKKEDGLSSTSFQEYAQIERSDGTFVFGSYHGFNIFHPRNFKDTDFEPDVSLIVTDFEQHSGSNDKIEDRLSEFLERREIVLKPDDKFFNIKVMLADYRVANGHRFAYKIEGFQEEWLEDKNNLIRINGLPYGKFILKIRGRLHNDLFAEPILEIPIYVLKPFYLQTWFILLSIVIICFGAYWWYKRRTQDLLIRQLELEKAVTEATETISQQNKELKNLDKVKSRFFANVSHELRTPITLILGPLTSLVKSGKLDNRSAHFAELGRKNAKSLLNLVNEILDLTKMESGKIELQAESTHLFPMIELLTGAFEGMASQKGIDYRFNYEADENLWLDLDVKKIQKIINNLLSNAFKFTPNTGQIILLVKEIKNKLHISVQDSGRGIHPNDLPNVFDRFYQSAQPDTPKEGGTGIGLSLCMEFAKLMNGKLWVESELGKGSVFHFEVPKINASYEISIGSPQLAVSSPPLPVNGLEAFENQESRTESRQTSAQNAQPATLLLVEDNDNLRDYIKLIVSEKYEVIAAENGKVAWELLTVDGGWLTEVGSPHGQPSTVNRPPSLIISDIMMPEMDGYQLLEKLKSSDDFRSTPVIMLTALAELKDKLKALRIGVDDYMTKPFEEEELLARIENLLKHRRWRKEHRKEIDLVKEGEKITSEALEKEDAGETIAIEMTAEDSAWLEELETAVYNKLGDFNFSMEILATEMASNRWTIYRRLKQITGLTPQQYLKEIRLNYARQLLEKNIANSVKALAYEVGMRDVKYFSRQFKGRFGKLPSEYL